MVGVQPVCRGAERSAMTENSGLGPFRRDERGRSAGGHMHSVPVLRASDPAFPWQRLPGTAAVTAAEFHSQDFMGTGRWGPAAPRPIRGSRGPETGRTQQGEPAPWASAPPATTPCSEGLLQSTAGLTGSGAAGPSACLSGPAPSRRLLSPFLQDPTASLLPAKVSHQAQPATPAGPTARQLGLDGLRPPGTAEPSVTRKGAEMAQAISRPRAAAGPASEVTDAGVSARLA